MKIAQIVSHGKVNGVVTHCRLLIGELARRGHEIVLVHRPGAAIASMVPEGVERIVSPLDRRPSEFLRLGNLLRARGLDLIHTHGSPAHKYGAVFRVFGRVPVVATAHARHFQLHWIVNDRVIAPSQPTADYHARVNRVPRRRLVVVPHFYDMTGIAPVDPAARAAARAGLGLSPACFVVGAVGTIVRRKRQSNLVRTLPALLASGIDAHVVLVGPWHEGDEIEEIRRLAAGGLEGRVHLPGRRADVLDLMAAFDVCACTSSVEEGPVAVQEAMAVGLPVVSTPVGAVGLMVEDGVNGYVTGHDDVAAMAARLADLAADPVRRAAFGRESRRILATRFAPDELVPLTEAVYRSLAPAAADPLHA